MRARAFFSLIAVACCAISSSRTFFAREDVQRVRDTWQDVTYEIVDPPEAARKGRWQVRLTPEASVWIYSYNKARGFAKSANGQIAPARNAEEKAWETWINAKVEYDRAVAAVRAAALNTANTESSELTGEDQEAYKAEVIKITAPSPVPAKLVELIGEPPAFAAAVRPRRHRVLFFDEDPIEISDQAPVSAKYAYFRFPQGVMSGGTSIAKLPAEDVEAIREASGIDDTAWRVMCAVSGLEGGFDSINTYDTGFVSVGLIQFTTGQAGTGSLGKVLLAMKERDYDAFDEDFRRFGIDVDESGVLIALDRKEDQELVGPEAVQAVVNRPELAAVFVRAGRRSVAFRAAQVRTAVERYFPGQDQVTVTLGGQKTSVKVSDIVRSEAGLATLMDRKVHTGRVDPLASVLNRVAQVCGADTVESLAAQEMSIVQAMRHRRDFTKVAELTQPEPVISTAPRVEPLTDRSGGRRLRKSRHK